MTISEKREYGGKKTVATINCILSKDRANTEAGYSLFQIREAHFRSKSPFLREIQGDRTGSHPIKKRYIISTDKIE